jgi:membrane associated rhomboid family serine protease
MSLPPSADPGAAAVVPVCPRHPDRESYVRCQRCERPVCPQCQRPAAVGVQCVDCVRAQGGSSRSARSIFGGRAQGATPRVTYTMIGICVLAYAAQLLGGDSFTSRFDYAPVQTVAEPYRMLTAAFLHLPSFPLHILFNLYAIWLIGPYLETLLGPLRYAALYLLSAFGGSVGFFVLSSPHSTGSWMTASLGASGAVFGLFAALLVVNRKLGRDYAAVIGVIVINAVLGFMPNLGISIAWQAHLGGLLTGGLVGILIVHSPRQTRRWLHPAGLAGLAVLLVLITLAKVATVPADLFL